jgi:hypothetical protein
VPVGGGTLNVTRMDGRRIDRICFRPAAPEPGAADRDEGSERGHRTERDDRAER